MSQTPEPPNKLFAMNLYKVTTCEIDEVDGRVTYNIESQVVFFTGPDEQHCRIVYSEFAEPGWRIGAITPVPPIETFRNVYDRTKLRL